MANPLITSPYEKKDEVLPQSSRFVFAKEEVSKMSEVEKAKTLFNFANALQLKIKEKKENELKLKSYLDELKAKELPISKIDPVEQAKVKERLGFKQPLIKAEEKIATPTPKSSQVGDILTNTSKLLDFSLALSQPKQTVIRKLTDKINEDVSQSVIQGGGKGLLNLARYSLPNAALTVGRDIVENERVPGASDFLPVILNAVKTVLPAERKLSIYSSPLGALMGKDDMDKVITTLEKNKDKLPTVNPRSPITAPMLKIITNTFLKEETKDVQNAFKKLIGYEEKREYVEKILTNGIEALAKKEEDSYTKTVSEAKNPFAATVGYNLASGLGSLAVAVGTTYATKSPAVAGALLGVWETSDLYNSCRASGGTPERCHTEFATGATGTAVLESVGLHYFFNTYGKEFFSKALSRFMSEGTQEASQALWNNLIEKSGFNLEKKLSDGLLSNFIYGGITGTLGGFMFDNIAMKKMPKSENGKTIRLVNPLSVKALLSDFANKITMPDKAVGVPIEVISKISQEVLKIDNTSVTSEADIFHKIRTVLDANGVDINLHPNLLNGLKGSVDNIGAHYAAWYEANTGTYLNNETHSHILKTALDGTRGMAVFSETSIASYREKAIKEIKQNWGVNNDMANDIFMLQGKLLKKIMPDLISSMKSNFSPAIKDMWEKLKADQRGFVQLPSLFKKGVVGKPIGLENFIAEDVKKKEAAEVKQEEDAMALLGQLKERLLKEQAGKKRDNIITGIEKKISEIEREYYDIGLPKENIARLTQRYVQDKANRLGILVKTIEKKEGRGLPDQLNVAQAERLFPGRSASQVDVFQREVVDEELKRIAQEGSNLDEFALYAYAKHAKERNDAIQEIYPDKELGSGMTTEDALRLLNEFKEAGKLETLEELRQFHYNNIVEKKLDILSEDFLSEEARERLENKYKYYTSLQANTNEEISVSVGKGLSPQGKPIRRATGRTTVAENPIIQDIIKYEEALILVEKNQVAKTLLYFAEKYPDQKVFTVRQERFSPVFNKVGELEYMQSLDKNIKDNEVVVMRKGKKYIVEIHDVAMANAFKAGTKEANKHMKGFASFIRKINSYLRLVNTVMSPSFMAVNFMRDIQLAGISMTAKEGKEASLSMVKNTPASIRGLYRLARGKAQGLADLEADNIRIEDIAKKEKLTTAEWSAMADSLIREGGQTGWFDVKTIDSRKKEFEKKVKQFNKTQTLENRKNLFTALGKLIMDANQSVEMGVRVSAYREMLRRGQTKKKSAVFAKGLTVNFNVKGNIAPFMEMGYLFYSAGMNGAHVFFSLMKHRKVQAIALFLTLFGASWAELMRMLDEEEWDRLAEYEKERSLNFVIPGEREGFSVPLTFGFNVFPYLGDNINSIIRGKKTKASAAIDMGKAFSNAFNPLDSATWAQMVSPTITDTIIQLWENVNWTGAPIRKEQMPFAKKRDSLMYFNSVSDTSREFTEWLNNISGGSYVKPGKIDINPETIDHLISGYTGGLGTDILKTVNAVKTIVSGEIPKASQLPILRRFLREEKDYIYSSRIQELTKKSELRELDSVDINNLRAALKVELESGRMSEDDVDAKYGEIAKNLDVLTASDALKEVNEAKTPEMRVSIFESLNNGQKKEFIKLRDKQIVEEALRKVKKSKDPDERVSIFDKLSDSQKKLFNEKYKK